MPKIINSVTEMKAFDVFINRLDMAEEILSELKAMSTETSKTENEREKKNWKQEEQTIQEHAGQLQSAPTCSVIGIPKEEEKKEQKKYLKQ